MKILHKMLKQMNLYPLRYSELSSLFPKFLLNALKHSIQLLGWVKMIKSFTIEIQ